ncbi:hypothetical protein Scep_001973 [Stephania cephalantha]|uniref:Uncharacterized protein n=1 Tax=Stephania cephalantha TaxID=152367 RepID=A0AAP0L923_9MAGN
MFEPLLVDDDLKEEKKEPNEKLEPNYMSDLHNCITNEEEAKTEVEVEHIQERSDEQYEESKEDQPLVLINPVHVSRILVKFEMGMEQKGHLEILCGVDNYVFEDQDYMDTYVLEFQDELKTLNEGMYISLPKATVNPFFVLQKLVEFFKLIP